MAVQKHRSAETRQKIESAALELFSRDGYDATGVADICTRAGISKGAFYHHFPTKQDVFLSLLNHWVASIHKSLAAPPEGTAAEVLRSMPTIMSKVLEDARDRLPIFIEFWRQASRDQAIWQATMAPYHLFRRYFAAIIQRGIEDGSLRPVDPQAAATALVSLAVGLLLQGTLDPTAGDWAAASRDSMELFLHGLETK